MDSGLESGIVISSSSTYAVSVPYQNVMAKEETVLESPCLGLSAHLSYLLTFRSILADQVLCKTKTHSYLDGFLLLLSLAQLLFNIHLRNFWLKEGLCLWALLLCYIQKVSL